MTGAGDGWDGVEPLPHRPAPHPDDRLWRHPAELGRDAGVARRRRRRRRATVGGACAATCVAAGTVGLVLASSPASPRPVAVEVPAAALAPAVGNSVVRVMISGGGTQVRGVGLVAGDDETVVTAGQLLAAAPPGGPIEIETAARVPVPATVVGVDTVTGVAVLHTSTPVGRAAPVDAGVAVITGRDLAAVATPAASESMTTTEVRAFDPDDGSAGSFPEGWVLSGNLDGWWGAPLLDSAGRVVAVVSATSWGTAVAVPAAAAVDVARQMVFTGHVVHGWVGLHARLAAGRLAVDTVDDNSPAADAGLHPGEVIVSVDGSPAADQAQLMATVRMARPGDVLVLGILDGGRRARAAVVVAEAPGG